MSKHHRFENQAGRVFTICTASMLMLSCQGSVLGQLGPGGSANPNQNNPGPGAPATPTGPVVDSTGKPICTPMGAQVGTAPMRRLTKSEYAASLRVWGIDAESVKRVLPSDERNGLNSTNPFSGNTLGFVSRGDEEGYIDAAETLAAAVDLPAFFGCDVKTESCMANAIGVVGKRLLRRPLTAEEKTTFLEQWKSQKADPVEGARLVLQTMLILPSFIYRPEVGEGLDEVRNLTPHELATRLSFYATGATPDEELLTLAESGALANSDTVLDAFRKRATSSAGLAQLKNFYGAWTEVGDLAAREKDAVTFPTFTAASRAKLQDETFAFFESVHRLKEPVSALLQSRRAFVSKATAEFYGVTAANDSMTQIELGADSNRQGFLTLPGVLAMTGHAPNHGSPIFRGKFIRFNMLCSQVAPPGGNVKVVLPPTQPGMTTRERYDLILTNKDCAGCHRLMNPLGYGFLKFDGIGRPMATDEGKAVDDSGEIYGVDEAALEGTFSGPKALSDKISGSDTFSTCFASQWLQFTAARLPEESERCTVASIAQKLKSGADIATVQETLILTDAFQKVRVK